MEKQFSPEGTSGPEALKIGDRVWTTGSIDESYVNSFKIPSHTPGIIKAKKLPSGRDFLVELETPRGLLQLEVNDDEIEIIPKETSEERAAA